MNNLYATINKLNKVEQSVFLVINDIIDNNTVFPDVNARNSLKKIAISTLGDRTLVHHTISFLSIYIIMLI